MLISKRGPMCALWLLFNHILTHLAQTTFLMPSGSESLRDRWSSFMGLCLGDTRWNQPEISLLPRQRNGQGAARLQRKWLIAPGLPGQEVNGRKRNGRASQKRWHLNWVWVLSLWTSCQSSPQNSACPLQEEEAVAWERRTWRRCHLEPEGGQPSSRHQFSPRKCVVVFKAQRFPYSYAYPSTNIDWYSLL